MFFEIIHQSKKSRARVGKIHTPHGIIETPGFVPVGTNATLKAIDSVTLEKLNVGLIFCNTYHLMINPGADIVAAAGGVHQFMRRKAPIITDSGGFQVFSLAYGGVHDELKSRGKKQECSSVIKISEEGVLFRSYKDGTSIFLTPESSVDAQKKIGADIILPLDELPPYHTTPKKLLSSFERTHRWQERSLQEHQKNVSQQKMYGIVHGGVDPLLRARSAEILQKFGFDGMAIGGSLGKDRPEMIAMLKNLMPHIDQKLPVHLLGIGDLPSLAEAIPLGIDTFDSSHPTKCARHGMLFTAQGPLKIAQNRYKTLFEPLDPTCRCLTCTEFSTAYIHHLFKAHEPVALQLASIHNIAFMMRLMQEYREKILADEI